MTALQLLRIDDRLIHGQVVIGWATHLNTKEIILCDDTVADNEWEKELYLSCVPSNIDAKILNVSDTVSYLTNKVQKNGKIIMLVESPMVIEQLLNAGMQIDLVNIGGMHFKDQRKKYLPYVYINEAELATFNRCMKRNVHFECLDVPNGKKVSLKRLILNENG
jgi:mannose/fructose/N-acetylgalactosamine-specific phosphotransferase system component IIB